MSADWERSKVKARCLTSAVLQHSITSLHHARVVIDELVKCSRAAQATGKLKSVTTVKTPMTLPSDATFEDYLAVVVEPDKLTEVLPSPPRSVVARKPAIRGSRRSPLGLLLREWAIMSFRVCAEHMVMQEAWRSSEINPSRSRAIDVRRHGWTVTLSRVNDL